MSSARCKECGYWCGSHMTAAPDDCPNCGHTMRWANRTDGKNKLKQFRKYYAEREARKATER